MRLVSRLTGLDLCFMRTEVYHQYAKGVKGAFIEDCVAELDMRQTIVLGCMTLTNQEYHLLLMAHTVNSLRDYLFQ